MDQKMHLFQSALPDFARHISVFSETTITYQICWRLSRTDVRQWTSQSMVVEYGVVSRLNK